MSIAFISLDLCTLLKYNALQMETQMTIRLPDDLNQKMREKAKSLRLKRSDIIRMALSEFLEGPDDKIFDFDKVKHLVGSVHSGLSGLGTNHREYIIQKLKQKKADGRL